MEHRPKEPVDTSDITQKDIDYYWAFDQMGKAKGLKEGIERAKIDKSDSLDNFLPFLSTASAKTYLETWEDKFPGLRDPEVKAKLEELSKLAEKVHARAYYANTPEDKEQREVSRAAAQRMVALLEDERVHRVVEEAAKHFSKK